MVSGRAMVMVIVMVVFMITFMVTMVVIVTNHVMYYGYDYVYA